MRRFILALSGTILTMLTFSEAYSIDANIKIGIVRPNSGPAKPLGDDLMKGIKVAFFQHQMKNDKLEKLVSLVEVDDQGVISLADQAAGDLFEKHRVHAVIGSVSNVLNHKIADQAKKAQRLAILPFATQDQWLARSNSVFSVSLSEIGQARQAMTFIDRNLRGKSVAIAFEETNFLAEEFSRTFVSVFSKKGGVVSGVHKFSSSRSIQQAVREIIKQRPGVILLPGSYAKAAPLIKQLDSRLSVAFIGTQGFDDPRVESSINLKRNKLYVLSLFNEKCKDSSCLAFFEGYKQIFPDSTPSLFAYLGYSAMDTMLGVYQAANSNRTEALVRQLRKPKRVKTMMGPFAVSSSGVIVRPAQIMVLSSGRLSYFGSSRGPYETEQ